MSRSEKVASEIKKEINKILREKVSDPRIGFLSIIDVDVSADLKNAKIFFSVLGDEKTKKETLAGLQSASSFVRQELGHALKLRFVPEISFIYDKGIERGSKVLSIMNRLKIEEEKKKHQTQTVKKAKRK